MYLLARYMFSLWFHNNITLDTVISNFKLEKTVEESSTQCSSCSCSTAKGVGRKISREPTDNQDRKIIPISLPPFYQWRVGWDTELAPSNHFKITLHQEPCIKSEDLFFGETFIFGKMTTFSKNVRSFSCEKTLYSGLQHLALIIPASYDINQLSKELRWLAGAEMFSQNECLVKNILAVSCVKIQARERAQPHFALSADAYAHSNQVSKYIFASLTY